MVDLPTRWEKDLASRITTLEKKVAALSVQVSSLEARVTAKEYKDALDKEPGDEYMA